MSDLTRAVAEQLRIKAFEPLNKVLSVTSNTADVKKAMALLGEIMAVVNPNPPVQSAEKTDTAHEDVTGSQSFNSRPR